MSNSNEMMDFTENNEEYEYIVIEDFEDEDNEDDNCIVIEDDEDEDNKDEDNEDEDNEDNEDGNCIVIEDDEDEDNEDGNCIVIEDDEDDDDEEYNCIVIEDDEDESHYSNNINASLDNNSQSTSDVIDLCDEDLDNPVVESNCIEVLKYPKNVKKILPLHRKKTVETIKFLTGKRKRDIINLKLKSNGFVLRAEHIINLLTPGVWLIDAVIQNYISLLANNCKETLIINTDDLESYNREKNRPGFKREYASVTRWIKQNNLFDNKRIVIAINPNQNHWAIFVVYIWQGMVYSLDSFDQRFIKEYNLVSEFLTLAYNYSIKKPGEERTMPVWKYQVVPCPRQKNTFDCGIFACTNARYFLFGKKLEYQQSDIELLRRRIAHELINNLIVEDHTLSYYYSN